MDSSPGEKDIPSVRMVSIVCGNMDNIQIPQRRLSWSDFNALRKEMHDNQKAMQEKQNQMQKHIETLEQTSRGPEEEHVGLLGKENGNVGVPPSEMEVQETLSTIEASYDKYELPKSTYSLLMTEDMRSVPFVTGIIAWAFSMTCLILAFANELDNGSPGNLLGLPAGVQKEVQVAQFLGILVGALMEDEIPQGLELIGKGAEQKISQRVVPANGGGSVDGTARLFSTKRVVLPALLRLSVGYMFIICLFLVVVQESTVLDIFFDVLALEFVENIDDVIFGLSKRGFFGHTLRYATNKTHYIETTRQSHRCRSWTKRLIRSVYIFNILGGVGLLSVVTRRQKKGYYRCKSISVTFGDAAWEEAFVNVGGVRERRPLIYANFNGIYEENGTHDGRPKYTERNKEDGGMFKRTVGAEIVFCEAIDAWVFRHEDISISRNDDDERDNECAWLLYSDETNSFDIIELADENEWLVWTGQIQSDYKVSIVCNECHDKIDCNFHGKCENKKCECSSDRFGIHCQFLRPCKVMRSEKDNTTKLKLLDDPNDNEVDFVEIYGRPMYVIHNMTGRPNSFLHTKEQDDTDYFADDYFFEMKNKSAEFQELLENYTFVLRYTGQQWYGQMHLPDLTAESFREDDYHEFWDSFDGGPGSRDDRTVIISESDVGGSPVGIDFYEVRRRNVADGIKKTDINQYWVVVPLVEYEGSGFFHCNEDKPE